MFKKFAKIIAMGVLIIMSLATGAYVGMVEDTSSPATRTHIIMKVVPSTIK